METQIKKKWNTCKSKTWTNFRKKSNKRRLERKIRNIKKISNDNTIIVIDIINPKINDIVDHKKYKLCGCLTINNNMCKLYEKHHYDYATQVVNYSKKYVLPNGIIKKFNLPVRIFFHQELINLFNLFDFEIINMLGDYNNENYNFDSRKQIVFIKKRSDKK